MKPQARSTPVGAHTQNRHSPTGARSQLPPRQQCSAVQRDRGQSAGVFPAEADDSAVPADRELVVDLWSSGGAGVQEAAEQALLGSDEDIRQFLDAKQDLQLAMTRWMPAGF